MFLTLVANEPETSRVQAFLTRHELVSSRLLVVEARRAAARQLPPPAADILAAALEEVDVFDIDSDVIAAASTVGPLRLRSLDAIHLASAVLIPGIDVFCSHDHRLADAGRALGLTVEDFR